MQLDKAWRKCLHVLSVMLLLGSSAKVCGGTAVTRYMTFEAPPEVIDLVDKLVKSDMGLAAANGELSVYQGRLQKNYPSLQGFFDVQMDSLWIAEDAGSQKHDRKLSAAVGNQKEKITIGYTFKSQGRGLIPKAQEAVLSMLTTSTRVLPAVSNWAVGLALHEKLLPADYNFSQISFGPSDRKGSFKQTPMNSVACCLSFDRAGTRLFQTPMTAKSKRRQDPSLQTRPVSSTTLCPETNKASVRFPYTRTAGISDVVFSAVAMNTAAKKAGPDPDIVCTAKKDQASSAALVTCKPRKGRSFRPSGAYKILLSASFQCGDTPLRAFADAHFSYQGSPSIALVRKNDDSAPQKGPKSLSVCSSTEGIELAYDYTVEGDDTAEAGKVFGVASSSVAGIECKVVIRPETSMLKVESIPAPACRPMGIYAPRVTRRDIHNKYDQQSLRDCTQAHYNPSEAVGDDSPTSNKPNEAGTATVTCKGPMEAGAIVDVELSLWTDQRGCEAIRSKHNERVSVVRC